MKKIIMLIMLVGATAFSLTSCNDDLEWQPTTTENIDFWMQSKLYLYYVDDKEKQLYSIDNPTTWPIISDKILSDTEVQAEMAKANPIRTTITMIGVNSSTKVDGFSYCYAHGFMAQDTEFKLPFLVPSVKANNTGKSENYIYITTSKGIDTDTLTTEFHYAKDKGETYTEITNIYYNKNLIYNGHGKNVGIVLIK